MSIPYNKTKNLSLGYKIFSEYRKVFWTGHENVIGLSRMEKFIFKFERILSMVKIDKAQVKIKYCLQVCFKPRLESKWNEIVNANYKL